MIGVRAGTGLVLIALGLGGTAAGAEPVPRPEHPTPDAFRAHWMNLNGPWQFRFDPADEGRAGGWSEPKAAGFDQTITVPFGWESELSGIHRTDARGVAWYRRTFRLPADFPASERVWIHFGAVDWQADVWVNGRHVAAHEGGYTPFSADITDALDRGEPATVTVRVFDPTDPGLPTGKQVGWYTPTSGIWQTVWIEARPKTHVRRFTIKADAPAPGEPAIVSFRVELAGRDGPARVVIESDDPAVESAAVALDDGAGGDSIDVPVKVRDPRLWSPESPFLYPVRVTVTPTAARPAQPADVVTTYFGIRTIRRGRYGDAPFERILLNGKPIYLRAALDQSFNPRGLYTAPSDAFLKHDIELAKSFGLNALRIHIKPDEPRRLYWADRLGVLILEDMPNTWRQNATARSAWEHTMREVVVRDRNHPSIGAWIAFNETWGLGRPQDYKADRDTQAWVGRMVDAIRGLDPTRLVEDHSPCNYDHIENTDLNSWHFYIDDHAEARRHIDDVVARTEPGSGFNYCPGLKQSSAPLINSEYGNVSSGSGDRDISWGFRDLTTLLRRQPKIQGYVYTELDDIEWEHNGFVNYDRTPKRFGYDAFVKGMTVADLQGADFIGYDAPPALVVEPGAEVEVPIFVSHYSDRQQAPRLRWSLTQVFGGGAEQRITRGGGTPIAWVAYGVTKLDPIRFRAAAQPCVGALGLELVDASGERIAANFVNIVVKPEKPQPRIERSPSSKNGVMIRFTPNEFARRRWSGPTASPPGKVVGQGRGFFEYHIRVPEAVAKAAPESISLWAELGAKAGREKVDWPERRNAQDYPQTDTRTWPSEVEFSVNGHRLAHSALADDAADARGVLSHLARFDHGSHGTLIGLGGNLPEEVRRALAAGQSLVIRLTVPDNAAHAGGLSVFGAGTGAYPSDLILTVRTRDPLPADLGVDPDATLAVDSAAARQAVLVAPGDTGHPPASWAYTTTEPGARWKDRDFDDGEWKRGTAGFGTRGTPGLSVGTRWSTPAIWLRKSVDVPRLKRDDVLSLHLYHDEDVEIYVNGRLLVRQRGYTTAYGDHVLGEEQKALFREGSNVVAVICRQTGGGQGVDLGLTLERSE